MSAFVEKIRVIDAKLVSLVARTTYNIQERQIKSNYCIAHFFNSMNLLFAIFVFLVVCYAGSYTFHSFIVALIFPVLFMLMYFYTRKVIMRNTERFALLLCKAYTTPHNHKMHEILVRSFLLFIYCGGLVGIICFFAVGVYAEFSIVSVISFALATSFLVACWTVFFFWLFVYPLYIAADLPHSKYFRQHPEDIEREFFIGL